jgi:YVTN family beta-propeller protein
MTDTIPVGPGIAPFGVAVTPDGRKVYIANQDTDGTVSVIGTATNTVTARIPVGSVPSAFGIFIQPSPQPPKFAGTSGKANCHGQSVSALAKQYGGLSAAAVALGFNSVNALQNGIMEFCEG